MIFRVLTGIASGLAAQPAAKALAAKLLKARGKELKMKKTESLLLMAVSAACGGVILAFSGYSPESVYLLGLLILSLTVAVTDIQDRIIPNETVLGILVLTLIFGIPSMLGAEGFPEFNIIQSLIGLGIMRIVTDVDEERYMELQGVRYNNTLYEEFFENGYYCLDEEGNKCGLRVGDVRDIENNSSYYNLAYNNSPSALRFHSNKNSAEVDAYIFL